MRGSGLLPGKIERSDKAKFLLNVKFTNSRKDLYSVTSCI